MNIRKFLVIFSSIFVSMQIIFFISIFFVNKKSVNQEIENILKKHLNSEIEVEHLNILSFPYPRIEIDNISSKNGDLLHDVVIYFNIFQIFSKTNNLWKITVKNFTFNKDNSLLFSDFSKKFHDFASDEDNLINLYIHSCIDGVDGKVYAKDLKLKKNEKNLDISVKLKKNTSLTLSAKKKNDIINSKTIFKNQDFDLSIATSSNNDGNFNANIKNLENFRDFLSSYFYFPQIKFKDNTQIAFQGIITNEDPEYITIKDVSVKGPHVYSYFFVKYPKSESNNIKVSSKIKHIDLDKIMYIDVGTIGQIQKMPMFQFNKFRIDFSLVGDNVNILSHDLKNLSVSGISNNGDLNISKIDANINESGVITGYGTLSKNQTNTDFIGFFEIKYNDFNGFVNKLNLGNFAIKSPTPFKLNFKLDKQDNFLNFNNIVFSYNFGDISGDLVAEFSSQIPAISGALNFDKVKNFPFEVPLYKKLSDYVSYLIFNTSEINYLSGYIPLRTLQIKTDLNLNFFDVPISERKFKKFGFTVKYQPSLLEIQDIKLENDYDNLNAAISLNSSKYLPSYKFEINGGKFDPQINSIFDISESFSDFSNKLDFSKVNFTASVSLDELLYKGEKIENLSTSFHKRGNNIVFDNLTFKIFEGFFQYAGFISKAINNLNFKYAINSVKLDSLLNHYFPGFSDFKNSYISSKGSFSSRGKNFKEFLFYLEADGDLITPRIQIDNFGFSKILEYVRSENYSENEYEKFFQENKNISSTLLEDFEAKFSIEKGVINMKNAQFKMIEDNVVGKAKAKIDIYDNINLDLIARFLFSINKNVNVSSESLSSFDKKNDVRRNLHSPFQIDFISKGYIFNPEKTFNWTDEETKELIKFIRR